MYSVYPVELLGGQGGEPFFSRAVGTLIGGAIVVAGASVFPRRAGPRLAAALARLADDLRDLLTRLTAGADQAELRTDVIDFRLHRAEAEATLDEAWAEPGRHGLDPRIGQKVLQELNIVGLYVADLLDGLSQPHPVLVEATMAGLSDVAGQLRTVSPTGELTAPANSISPPPGPPDLPGQLSASLALTALASCQQALDQARRHATSGTVG